jgi:hypothetical protein
MAIYCRLTPDGKNAFVVKALIERKMNEEEFMKKAKHLPTKEFVKRLPEEKARKVIEIARRLQALKAMKVTRFGKYVSSDSLDRTTTTTYWLGDKVFVHEYGECAEVFEREDAIKHGKGFYGEKFMAEHDIVGMEPFNFKYFKGDCVSGVEEISQEEYDAVKKEIVLLISIVSLNKVVREETGKR